ncbi:hypothetical protein [Candidatus Coxiella mudrowiae]
MRHVAVSVHCCAPKSKKLFLPSGLVGRESVNLSVKGVIEATE